MVEEAAVFDRHHGLYQLRREFFIIQFIPIRIALYRKERTIRRQIADSMGFIGFKERFGVRDVMQVVKTHHETDYDQPYAKEDTGLE